MLPVLLDFGFIKLYTYGVFLVLAFFWSAFFLWKNIALTAFKEDEVFDGLFISLAGATLVARIVYVALHFSDFGYDILRFLLINGYPGLNSMGFVAGWFLTLLIYCHMKKQSFLRLVDYVTGPFLLALGIAKIGSFFSGSEVGTQTSFVLALSYPHLDGMRHLTPLYESILFFLGSVILYKLLRQIRRGKWFEGFTLVFAAWFFGLVSTIFDPLKAFHSPVKGISFDMIVGSVILLTGSIYLLYYFRIVIFHTIISIPSRWKKK